MQNAVREIDGVSRAANDTKGPLGSLKSTLGDVAKFAGGFIVAQGLMQLPGLFSSTVDAGSNLKESVNAVNQIFDESATSILNWGENNANSFGLSQRAFNDLAVPLGAGLKNAGLSMDDVSKHTLGLTERAADMASVFNTDVGEALAAIQAGLRGEADPLERYGVGLSAAAVQAEALALSGKNAAKDLTTQELALARVALIMKQTDDVAGDFVNTSDEAANSARIAAAKQEELAAVIGTKLLPIQKALTDAKLLFMEVIATKVLPAVFSLASTLEGPVKRAFSLVRDGVLSFVQALQGNWSDNENIHGLHRVFGNLGLIVREQVIPAIRSMASFFVDTLWPVIQSGLGVVQGLVSAFSEGGIGGALSALPGLIGPHLQVVGEMLLGLGQKLVDWIAPMIPPMLEKLGELALSIGSWVVDEGLPMLAEALGGWADAFGAWVSEAVPPLLEQLALLLEATGTWIADEGLPLLFDKLQLWGQALIDWVGPRIVPVLEALGSLLLAIGEWIVTVAAPGIAGKLLEWGQQFVAWVGPHIGPMLSALGGLLLDLGSWLINTALPEIGAKLLEWGKAFVDWVAPQIPPLLIQLGVLLMTVAAWIVTDGIPKIVEKLVEWGAAFVGWIAKDVLPELPGKLAAILTTIGGWVADNAGELASKGAAIAGDLLSGIASGIYSKGEAIVGTALGWLGDLVPGWARKALEAFSPARVMIPVGVTIPEGVAVGIERGQRDLERVAFTSGAAAAAAYGAGVASHSGDSGGAVGGAGSKAYQQAAATAAMFNQSSSMVVLSARPTAKFDAEIESLRAEITAADNLDDKLSAALNLKVLVDNRANQIVAYDANRDGQVTRDELPGSTRGGSRSFLSGLQEAVRAGQREGLSDGLVEGHRRIVTGSRRNTSLVRG
jgi:hypothetical protein